MSKTARLIDKVEELGNRARALVRVLDNDEATLGDIGDAIDGVYTWITSNPELRERYGLGPTQNGCVKCADCRYYNLGHCQIDPPRVIALNNMLETVFPILGPDNWCGQGVKSFEERESKRDR